MIGIGIEQRLVADAGVTALIATRLYPVLLPTVSQLPAGTYQLISSVAENTNDGPDGYVRSRVQTDAWAESYIVAWQIATAFSASLNGFMGTLPDGIAVQNILRDNVTDYLDPDSRLYRVQTDWIVLHTAS